MDPISMDGGGFGGNGAVEAGNAPLNCFAQVSPVHPSEQLQPSSVHPPWLEQSSLHRWRSHAIPKNFSPQTQTPFRQVPRWLQLCGHPLSISGFVGFSARSGSARIGGGAAPLSVFNVLGGGTIGAGAGAAATWAASGSCLSRWAACSAFPAATMTPLNTRSTSSIICFSVRCTFCAASLRKVSKPGTSCKKVTAGVKAVHSGPSKPASHAQSPKIHVP